MLSQYNAWYNATAPLDQMTDVTEAQVLQEQGAWATAEAGTGITASETNGTVTVTNSGTGGQRPDHRARRHHGQRRGVRPGLRRRRCRTG